MGLLNEEQLEQLVNSGGGGKYLRLEQKEKIHGVFVGEAYDYYRYWDNVQNRTVIGNKDGIAKLGQTPKLRVAQNFVDVDGNVKIFDASITTFKAISDHMKTQMKPGESFAIEIERTQDNMNPYKISKAICDSTNARILTSTVLNNFDETLLFDLVDLIAPQEAAFEATALVNNTFGNVSSL